MTSRMPAQIQARALASSPAPMDWAARTLVAFDKASGIIKISVARFAATWWLALAIVPKLEEWNSIFISSDNGDGRLTAASFVPNFFRANTSGPMGTRAVSLYLRDSKAKKFFALGLDYAWGHNSIQV